jgi:hypothetical protein
MVKLSFIIDSVPQGLIRGAELGSLPTLLEFHERGAVLCHRSRFETGGDVTGGFVGARLNSRLRPAVS